MISVTAFSEARSGQVRKFRLTLLFLVISAITLGLAAVAINFAAARTEEQNLVNMTTAEATKDAKLIAGVVSRMLSEEPDVPAHVVGVLNAPGASLTPPLHETPVEMPMVSEFLSASNIYRLALYDLEGDTVWSSTGGTGSLTGTQHELLESAVAGRITSGLLRQQELAGPDGSVRRVDVVETYIPFMAADSDRTVEVLTVSRDVTSRLAMQIGTTRTAMLRTTMISLGSAFVVLLGFILGADHTIWSSSARSLRQQRALADQRLVAARLDIENRELQRLNDETARFISTVSHELKTPLTSVVAFTDILMKHQDGAHKERNLHQLKVIRRNGDQLKRLIDDLLDLSRIEAGSLQVTPEEFDPAVLFEEIRQDFEPILAAKRQRLHLALSTGSRMIHADRVRITQVVMNLVSNASKYSPEGTRIDVTAEVKLGRLNVSVRDYGPGIAEEDRKRLFTKFFRVDNEATRRVPGTGLGLAIVKGIVELHGGAISVESAVGVGTEVKFHVPAPDLKLPAAVPAALPEEAPEPAQEEARLPQMQPRYWPAIVPSGAQD